MTSVRVKPGWRRLMLGVAVATQASGGWALTAAVDVARDAPALILDGVATVPMMFFGQSQVPERLPAVAPQVRLAAGSGVHLYQFETKIPWTGAAYGYIDAAMDAFVSADPQARFIVRVKMEVYDQAGTLRIPTGEDNSYADGSGAPVSMASDAYFEAYVRAVRSFIQRSESGPYRHRIAGYLLGGGENLMEWFPDQYRTRGIDYSAANASRFRRWLATRYASDGQLTAAWGRSVTLVDAPLPTASSGRFPLVAAPAQQAIDAFYRLPEQRDWVDYSLYQSDLTTERILALARVVKENSGRQKLAGFFYGYVFDLPGSMSGHLGLARLLRSPDVDFLAAPLSYLTLQERLGRGAAAAMSAIDSVSLHGKLWFNEDDLRTWRAAESTLSDLGFNGHLATRDAAETRDVLLRNAAYALAHRAGTWWMDLNGVGAFDDASLWGVVREWTLPAYAEGREATAAQPEVCLLIDERSVVMEFAAWDLMYASRTRLRNALQRTGVRLGTYLLEDFTDGTLPRCRVYLFANAWALSDSMIDAIRSRLTLEQAVAIWQHAGGFLGDPSQAATAEAGELRMSRLTGIALRRHDGPMGTLGSGALAGLSWGLDAGRSSRLVSPRFEVVDPGAEILGRYASDGRAAAARRTVDGVTSIVLGDLANDSPAMLQRLLAAAGVHVYLPPGDVVLAAGSRIVVHAASAGVKRLRLPPRTGTLQGDRSTVELTLRAGESVSVATKPRDAESCLLAWAEQTYADILAPPDGQTLTAPPFRYRHYAATQAYVGISTDDWHLYYLGPLSSNMPMDLGPVDDWLTRSGCPLR